ncbi:hypothetical protein TorRG33x02_026910, partial [Trema orientale]
MTPHIIRALTKSKEEVPEANQAEMVTTPTYLVDHTQIEHSRKFHRLGLKP